jgi:hypothetical protein
MTEYRKTVSLKISEPDIHKYRPPPGINLAVFEYDRNQHEAYAQFIINSEHPDIRYRRYREDIDNELARLKVAMDNISNYRNAPKGQQMRYELNPTSITNDMDYLRSRVRRSYSQPNSKDYGEVDIK